MLHSGSKAKTKGIPETMARGIPVFFAVFWAPNPSCVRKPPFARQPRGLSDSLARPGAVDCEIDQQPRNVPLLRTILVFIAWLSSGFGDFNFFGVFIK